MGRVVEKFRERNGTLEVCPTCSEPLPPFVEEWGGFNTLFWAETIDACCVAFLEARMLQDTAPFGWEGF